MQVGLWRVVARFMRHKLCRGAFVLRNQHQHGYVLSSRFLGCGAKRTCREMTSCDEARFYLTQCGVSRLDGDKDGMPCEALCR